MPDAARVVLRSSVIPPDAAIAVATSVDWDQRLVCSWQADLHQWAADVPLLGHTGPLELKFLRSGRWQSGLNLVVPADELAAGPHYFGDLEVAFTDPAWTVDTPTPGRRFFDPEPATMPADYDVIVVGSGMGGGVLAYTLAAKARGARRMRVLVVEAGGYLFPTHVGNLPRYEPRPLREGQQPWDVRTEFQVPLPLEPPQPAGANVPEPSMSRVLALGGRSLLWGCLSPEAQDWELAAWPKDVVAGLRAYYPGAGELMRVSNMRGSAYEVKAVGALRAASVGPLAAFTHSAAPIAAELAAPTAAMIPTGMFSTAELLLERKLTNRGREYPDFTVLLNQQVLTVSAQGVLGARTAAGVTTRDRVSGTLRTFSTSPGGVVVLAAGSTVTPLIARASGFSWPTGADLVGVGLTDHPIWVQTFRVPQTAQPSFFRTGEAAVILSRPRVGRAGSYPFNIKVALNTHLTLARMVDPRDVPGAVPQMPAEIVYLLSSSLLEANKVDGDPVNPTAAVNECPTPSDEVLAVIDETTGAILTAFGGEADAPGYVAPFGAVGHEVGTMRMVTPSRPGVVDGDLQLGGTDNVYVCDLSVFPTSPAANPSLTLTALALRLADHLTAVLG